MPERYTLFHQRYAQVIRACFFENPAYRNCAVTVSVSLYDGENPDRRFQSGAYRTMIELQVL